MNDTEQRGVLSICILAALADGGQSDAERDQIHQIADGFQPRTPELASAYQEVLAQKPAVTDLARTLESPEAKSLAYEMAVCVCHADGAVSSAEQGFLDGLRRALQLPAEATANVEAQAQQLTRVEPNAVPPRLSAVSAPPMVTTVPGNDLDSTILNYAILTGALEMLPHTLATMSIIPLQMKMVYQVGRRYGIELSKGHIAEFLATVGVGLTSQVIDGFARRLFGNFARHVGGRLIGGLAGQAAGSAVAFGTTYALGQVAKRYYASGRTLTAAQLKDVFSSLLSEGSSLQSRYTDQIAQRSRQINPSDLLSVIQHS